MVLDSLISNEKSNNLLEEQEGNWITVEERYCNPPWESVELDLTDKIYRKQPLKIIGIEAGRFLMDEEGCLKGLESTQGNTKLVFLYEFLSELCTKFNKKLLVVFHPVELDVLVKSLGFESLVSLIQETRISWGSFQLFYTPNRNLTIKYNGKTVKIQPLYDWFAPSTYAKVIEDIEDTTELKDLFAFKKLAELLLTEIKTTTKSLPHSLASATAITDMYMEGPLRKFDRSSIPREVYEFAYNSFHAPWIEMIKTGSFRDLIEYDLNAAYPYEVGELLDITPQGGIWKFYKSNGNTSLTEVMAAEYGFFYAYIHIREDVKVSPIFCRKGQKLFSSVGSWLGMITLDEVKFIEEFNLGEVTLLTGYYFEVKTARKLFKKDINKYRNIRSRAKSQHKELLELVIKASTVRFVGKFLQKTFPPLGGSEASASPAFNPIYATIVMTRVKLKVARLAMLNPDKIANVIVDGLASTEPLDIPKDFEKKYGIELKQKTVKNALLINPHMIYYTKPEREILQDILRKDPTKTWYRIPNKTYMRVCESLAAGRFESIGSTKSDGINFEVGFDRKRFWPNAPKFGLDLLRYQYDSLPHNAKTLDLMYPYFEDKELKNLLTAMGRHIT